MSDKYREWKKGGLVVLDEHSRAKHDVLRTYIERYLKILCQRYGVPSFKITLVDGFAGGGLYKDGELGSPLILLQAVESAEAEINEFRQKRMVVDAHYYFIEEDKRTFDTLQGVLQKSRYKEKIDKTVFLRNGSFEKYIHVIIENVRKRSPKGGGRAIFFLDTTGYSQVCPNVIRGIFKKMPKAEFIITITTDNFVERINDKRQIFKHIINKLGFEPYLNIEEILRLKEEHPNNWKYIIEAKFSFAWQQVTGATYTRPFFIEPEYNHRGYWLLHLSPHSAAHDAMTDIHWEKGNYFRHYGGGLGLDIFGYKPQLSSELSGMSFNETFRQDNKERLRKELPRLIWEYKDRGIRFEEFIDMNRNVKAVSNHIIEEVLLELQEMGDIEILSKKGRKKRSGSLFEGDIILPQRQKRLI